MDVLPIPPAPIKAMGVEFSARLTTSSISSSRPKQAGDGGGNSPGGILDVHVRPCALSCLILLTWAESKGW